MFSLSSVTASEPLSSLWRKAAILGSLWAAFEILWGSLLHSLRIPFAGMMLAAGGVCLMAAGRRLWPEKGLIWRGALVCAMMKSISPSSVILGPMAGILAEGLLMEVAFRLLGSNPLAAAAGGALAVCWTLVQKLIALLLTFFQTCKTGVERLLQILATLSFSSFVIQFNRRCVLLGLFLIDKHGIRRWGR